MVRLPEGLSNVLVNVVFSASSALWHTPGKEQPRPNNTISHPTCTGHTPHVRHTPGGIQNAPGAHPISSGVPVHI